ncbi:hypothetical protein HJG54_33630 [Leptolyngbya sp. NK1-12]|uniref:Cytochrome c domain-containing protein n=1 Tax=Leptolyngbya sp. NK1-12 TaxID=2547451 RepID=A0AA96WLM1_9CYAN|nr:hypothetical protein [Leptolyngbya sp. NK1-12]WNZ27778.1 hypothetical protein HJG54_33630 [Leptolyngbya sp. NK1-12]
MRLRVVIILVALLGLAGFLGYQMELALPAKPPDLNATYTPLTHSAPRGIGSYDVLGQVISKAEAEQLLQTEAGREHLSPENGAVEITEDLLELGRRTFYQETFGNDVLFTDVVGILDGPLGISKLAKSILALKGQPTSNLQVTLDEEVKLGNRTFPAGTMINTGLDVAEGSLVPLGLVNHFDHGKLRVGITCALCHATVNEQTGRVIEGATNTDINLGMLLAMAANSAVLFRQTDVKPTEIPADGQTYLNSEGEMAQLPDPQLMEDTVDEAFLSLIIR